MEPFLVGVEVVALLVKDFIVLPNHLVTWDVMGHFKVVQQCEDDRLVLKSHLQIRKVGDAGRIRVIVLQVLALLREVLHHEDAELEDDSRVSNDPLCNLEFHALLQRVLQAIHNFDKFLLEHLHLETLQEENAHFVLQSHRDDSKVRHSLVRVVQLILLLLLLRILLLELVNENTDQVRVNHCVDHVDAEHEGHLGG